MGTGTFLLSKYCSDLERIFKRKVHLDWFNTYEELVELINFYLKNDDVRETIARRGYKYVSENFTWHHTIKNTIDIVNSY